MTTDRALQTFLISEGTGDFEIHAQVNLLGRDLQVNLVGGANHIGAVGMAEARPSLADPRKSGATSSVFTFLSHKEDEIVKPMAEELAKRLNGKVVVVAGVHREQLSPEGIEVLMGICGRITEKIVKEVTTAHIYGARDAAP
ncbi:MAG: hypothetical protein LBQ00_09450 [Syntrophobacterales bacterium]|jgi:hypothetical protein|nr:hypothetical protein [Syntrophobacterales bacterium]